MGNMDMSGMAGMGGMAGMAGMGGMAMDLNDYAFDAYLANDRTLADPEVVSVGKAGRVLIRIINASAATVFWIDTGELPGRLVAVDGEPVAPLSGTRFGIAMAQRLDIEVDVPVGGGAFPILALREGARERTGIILATPGAAVAQVAELSDADHPAFSADLSQEAALRSLAPLAERPADRTETLMLGGSMMPYVWTINGQTWSSHIPVAAKSGERVEISFHNMSMMAHPMHLHGHAFQVVDVNGQRIAGALRDTLHVPPMAMITVAVDAGEAARWMLHCHHMAHLATGMMTEFAVSD
jgi:FtsP/CotA-like multicopper oxidase with cupredoxin domain